MKSVDWEMEILTTHVLLVFTILLGLIHCVRCQCIDCRWDEFCDDNFQICTACESDPCNKNQHWWKETCQEKCPVYYNTLLQGTTVPRAASSTGGQSSTGQPHPAAIIVPVVSAVLFLIGLIILFVNRPHLLPRCLRPCQCTHRGSSILSTCTATEKTNSTTATRPPSQNTEYSVGARRGSCTSWKTTIQPREVSSDGNNASSRLLPSAGNTPFPLDREINEHQRRLLPSAGNTPFPLDRQINERQSEQLDTPDLNQHMQYSEEYNFTLNPSRFSSTNYVQTVEESRQHPTRGLMVVSGADHGHYIGASLAEQSSFSNQEPTNQRGSQTCVKMV